MKFPFLTNNPRLNSDALLTRLTLEMAQAPENGGGVSPTPVPAPLPAPPAPLAPAPQAWRPGGGLLGKALRWAKSLLLLQRTRHKVHTLEQAQRDLEQAQRDLQTQLASTSVALRHEITRASKEVEALSESGIDALREEIATWRQRQDLLAMEIAFQQSRLNRALARLTAAPAALTPGPATCPDGLDGLYVSFEEVFRGTREEIKGRVRRHVEKFALAGAGRSDRPVLDLGCGRGEWLEVLRDHGLAARGIDLNTCNIEICRSLGLTVAHDDALAALENCPDSSLGGVSAFHLVEHLPFEVLVAMIDEALRALAEGGILLFETPNPESLMVGGRNFFFDPTHRHPIPPQVLSFVLERRGFAAVEVVRLHPYGQEHHLDATQGQAEALLNELLFGPQDYAVIGRKP